MRRLLVGVTVVVLGLAVIDTHIAGAKGFALACAFVIGRSIGEDTR